MNTKALVQALVPHNNNRNPIHKKRALALIKPKMVSGLRIASSSFIYLQTMVDMPLNELTEIEQAFSTNIVVLLRILRLCGETVQIKYVAGHTQATITSGTDTYHIDVEDESAYLNGRRPSEHAEDTEQDITFSMPYQLLYKLVKNSEPFVSRDIRRAVLNGVCVRQYKDRIRFLATDGRAVSDFSYPEENKDLNIVSNVEHEYNEIIIPMDVMKILSSPKSKLDSVTITKKGNAGWSLGDVVHLYPDVDKAFTGCKPTELCMSLDTKSFMKAMVNTSTVFHQDNSRTIMSLTAEIEDEHNIVVFQSKQTSDVTGYYETAIPFEIKYLDDDNSYADVVHFNGQFMRKIIKSIDSDSIFLFLHGHNEPLIIMPDPQDELITARYLLMPLRGQ
jgi:DNA polymerase III sliding clamp (beta) subunit (PCNA family)